MNEVLQTNVFFIITSVAVLVLTILVSVALVYLIRILRNVQDVTERIKRGSERLAEDAESVRSFVNQGIIGSIKTLFAQFSSKGKASHRTKKSAEEGDGE